MRWRSGGIFTGKVSGTLSGSWPLGGWLRQSRYVVLAIWSLRQLAQRLACRERRGSKLRSDGRLLSGLNRTGDLVDWHATQHCKTCDCGRGFQPSHKCQGEWWTTGSGWGETYIFQFLHIDVQLAF